MPMIFTRKAVLPVSLVVFAMLALFGPFTFVQSAIVLAIGVLVPTMVLMLWKDRPDTMAETLHRANTRQIKE